MDIDVYLAPLIDELKSLWEVGIETYDVDAKESFTMRAALLWTINDFPAYANLQVGAQRDIRFVQIVVMTIILFD